MTDPINESVREDAARIVEEFPEEVEQTQAGLPSERFLIKQLRRRQRELSHYDAQAAIYAAINSLPTPEPVDMTPVINEILDQVFSEGAEDVAAYPTDHSVAVRIVGRAILLAQGRVDPAVLIVSLQARLDALGEAP